ncbi:Integrin-linked protein kinase 1 (Ankyrin protein kinase 1) [Durusdinium trenchii]|uniref:Integrin-linked protein kinase 1 (Ankyrin protein kinase 1) n=1 Tax=Durusdinium trenchii TaxID=1381693 RepID=A0ABP0LA82_9DINO
MMPLGYVGNTENQLPILLGRKDAIAEKEPDRTFTRTTTTNVSEPELDDKSNLFSACAAGDPVNTERLLKSIDINSKDYGGRTPLHLACGCRSAGGLEAVKILLQNRADANAADHVGMTPMDIAVKVQNFAVRKLLENNGVELQPALEQKARESSWLLKASEFQLRKEIGNTLKSVVHLADWNGTTVVVKCIKMKRRVMIKKMRKSNSLCLSLAADDLETPLEPPAVDKVASAGDEEIEHACSEELLHEIQLLSSLRHPDLVLFLGACLGDDMPVMFVTEYMPKGDVEHYLYKMRDEKQVAHYAPPLWRTIEWCMSVARALAFLHKFPVIHRDLKPLNLLLTKTLDVKVTDFGTSKLLAKPWDCEDGSVDVKVLKRSTTQTGTQMTMGVGTYNYMAPEVVRTKKYDEKVDIYALALIMFYLSSGKRPFYHLFVRGNGPTELLDRFVQGEDPRPDARECHKLLRGIMEQCWAVKPSERPSAKEKTTPLL